MAIYVTADVSAAQTRTINPIPYVTHAIPPRKRPTTVPKLVEQCRRRRTLAATAAAWVDYAKPQSSSIAVRLARVSVWSR